MDTIDSNRLMEAIRSDDLPALKTILDQNSSAFKAASYTARIQSRIPWPPLEDAFAQFLLHHTTLTELACCSLATNCFSHLLQLTNNATLTDDQCCPVHCLIVKLSVVNCESVREKAVKFLKRTNCSHPDQLSQLLDKEAFGMNALELAVHRREFAIAEWILHCSSRYCSCVVNLGAVQVRSIDLTEYSFPWGERQDTSPLTMLSDMTRDTEPVSDALKRLWDSKVIAHWSSALLSSNKKWLLLNCLLTAVLWSFVCAFCAPVLYRNVNSNVCNGTCLNLKIFGSFEAPEKMSSPSSAMVFVTTVLMASNVLSRLGARLYILGTQFHLKSAKSHIFSTVASDLRWFAPFLFMLLGPVLVVSSFFLPVVQECEGRGILSASTLVNLVDTLFALVLTVALVSIVADIGLVSELFFQMWCLVDLLIPFLMFIGLVTMSSAWLYAIIIPCEPIFYASYGSQVTNIWLGFYRTVSGGGSFSQESLDRLGLLYLSVHMLFSLFFFNVLIAFLSDRLAVVSVNTRYLMTARQLQMLAVLGKAYTAVAALILKRGCKRTELQKMASKFTLYIPKK